MTFKPRQMTIILWDLFMSILTVFQMCKTTFMLAFNMDYEDRLLDTIIDAVFAIDILMHFFRAYLDDVEVITSFGKISLRYITGFFLFDSIATFPTLCTYNWKTLYPLKLARFFRIFRFTESIKNLINQVLARVNLPKRFVNRIHDFAFMTVFLMIVVHSIASAWIKIGHEIEGSWKDVHG